MDLIKKVGVMLLALMGMIALGVVEYWLQVPLDVVFLPNMIIGFVFGWVMSEIMFS